MKKLFLLLFVLLVSACSAEPMPAAPSDNIVKEVETVVETSAPTAVMEVEAQAEAPAAEGEQPAPTEEESSSLPDLSSVSLFEAAHLMDPSNFQVSLNGWPVEIAEDLSVVVGEEAFNCDVLFQDEFPDRVYCWGKTPGKPGEQMAVKVYYSGSEEPLVEIEFMIPSPGAGGGS